MKKIKEIIQKDLEKEPEEQKGLEYFTLLAKEAKYINTLKEFYDKGKLNKTKTRRKKTRNGRTYYCLYEK